MKKFYLLIAQIFWCFSLFSQFGSMPPYTVQIEAINGINIPGIHSFAFAKSGTHWLFVGGRTNGLHGLNSNDGFPSEYKKDNIMVVDTTTWQYYTADLNQLPWNIADPLRSTNMQYIQDGKYLYMIGGYGYDSIVDNYVTFSTLSALHVDSIINAVINSMPISSYVRQISDTNFRVCGGELSKLGSQFYLMFGHNFNGVYTDPPTILFTQEYSNRIKKFNLSDDDFTITTSNFSYQTDTTNFHRRDLNVAPIIKPGGAFALAAYGGVFKKNVNLPFRQPIRIDSTSIDVDTTYEQVMSQYTCALIPVFDSLKQAMYTTFFGGISVNDFDESTGLVTYDSLVPFINDITTLSVKANGTTEETIMPSHLSGLLGSNAKFIFNDTVPHFDNDIIDIRRMPNAQTLVGYMFGGIRASLSNLGASVCNDSIYRIYITPNNSSNIGIAENSININNLFVYPNPSIQTTSLFFKLAKAEIFRIALLDMQGSELMVIANEKMLAGNNKVVINTSKLPAGIYVCKLQSNSSESTVKLSVVK